MGYRIAVDGEVLNVLRWTTRPATPGSAIPPGELQPHPPFGGQRPPVVTRGRVRGVGLHPRPPRPGALHRLPHARHAHRRARAPRPRRRAVRLRLLRGPRQGVARVRPRRAVRRGAALDRPPRRHAPRGRSRRAPRWSSPPTTARSRPATTCSSCPSDVLTHVAMQSGEGRFRWLHARAGRAPRAGRRGRRRCSATTPGCAPASRPSPRAGTARRSPTPPPVASATCCSPPRARSPSSTRKDTGPVRARRPPRLAHRRRDARAAPGRASPEREPPLDRLAAMSDPSATDSDADVLVPSVVPDAGDRASRRSPWSRPAR